MGDSVKIPSENRTPELIIKSFAAGGIAGMCSKSAVAPLDRVKILLQAHNESYKQYGVTRSLYNVCKNEGFLALYKGNGAQMVRVFPYAAIQFTAYETYAPILTNLFGQNFKDAAKMVAGSVAGLTAVCCTYPLDMVRARLAFQVTGQHVYTGIANAMTSIYLKEGGIRAMYCGFTPTLLGIVPYAGLSFYCFEKIKNLCIVLFPKYTTKQGTEKTTGGLVLTVPFKLLSGGLAGAVAQMVAYPFDVTRRRMQLSMMHKETHKFSEGCFKALYLTYKENGIVRGLYRGMSINYLRAIPMVSVSFCSYELMKQALDLDTGMRN